MLRKLRITLLLFCPGLLALGQNCFPPVYQPEDSIKVCSILKNNAAHSVSYCGKQLLGIPYVAHTLEGYSPERLVVNLRELDCSTFMETAMALAMTARMYASEPMQMHTDTFALFCRNLQKIRYHKGVINEYPSRLHYICQWAKDNSEAGIIEDITRAHSSSTYPVRIGYMSMYPDKYTQLKQHPEFVPVIRRMEEECNQEKFAYLPKNELPEKGKDWIQEGDLIAMVTTKAGLDVSHVGIAIYQNGKLHLMHASMIEKKVILDPRPLSEQINRKSCPGIRVFRLKA